MTDCIRLIQDGDRNELRSLWSLRFNDPPAFVDWYFQDRYCTEYSMCMLADDRIVSVIHASPMHLRIRGKSLPALMLSGVATLPGYERQGRMHRLLHAVVLHARESGFPLVFHKPVQIGVYASVGHLPCTDTLLHQVESGTDAPVFCSDWDCKALLDRYQRATESYSGIVVRDESAMQMKIDDYRSDHAFLIRPHDIDGYAILFRNTDEWFAEEVLASNAKAYAALMQRLPANAVAKLPPDCGLSGTVLPQNVMGAANVSKLLALLCGNVDFTVSVTDPLLPENNDCLNGLGQPVSRTPSLICSSGELLQYLCGYRAFAPYLSLETCYCVDEY